MTLAAREPIMGIRSLRTGDAACHTIEDSRVDVTIALTTPSCPLKGQIESDIRREFTRLPGVGAVSVGFGTVSPEERVHALAGEAAEPTPARQMSNVKQGVAVMSGKGGVGKSLVTSMPASSLARKGLKVGILESDITDPSIHKMFGLDVKAPIRWGRKRRSS